MRLSSMPYYSSIKSKYILPEGMSGIGKDIKWCDRQSGGKRCMLCRHHATFDVWSQDWHWYYLTGWYNEDTYYKNAQRRHPSYYERSEWRIRWTYHNWYKCIPAMNIRPKRYRNTGISDKHIRSLMKKGCKNNKKCRCVSLVQRGSWYCPECYKDLLYMAQAKKLHIHDLIISDRDEIKKEILINNISGINPK